MKVFRTLALVIVAFIVVVLILAALKPSTYSVTRSVVIAASPEKIHPLLDNYHAFETWSPWAYLNGESTITISGAPSGPGAVYEWTGSRRAGAGRMEITSDTPTQVVESMQFIRPFASTNTITLTLAPAAGSTPAQPQTQVTWTMSGPQMFIGKVMSVFKSYDSMIGPDFERGLANLKQMAEK